ncbi:metallophosphoesterase family protein [Algoriphagus sp. NG3]|uniref:metallophosphoesterase family protein n=1 Tax=Algoriphagus sp. NG3 TaxID=3097546 RepID=UPI002A827021|nr:metallophosphoesterase family protein [Algoriphagus sp. NG3]WPR75807.1 metallophosphoesterase family protein [Algoriphagus sp. NG3]
MVCPNLPIDAKYDSEKQGKPFDASQYHLGNIVITHAVKEARDRDVFQSKGRISAIEETAVVWNHENQFKYMKIAFFSDVHANLPALKVVLKDIERENPDRVFCLGDMVGYHIWPEEVVRQVRKLGVPTLMGNHEEGLQLNPEIGTNGAITLSLISLETKNYLLELPRELNTSYELDGKKMNLWMVHGSPKAIDDYMTEDYPEQEVLSMMRERNADILLCGHTHKPFHRVIQDGDKLRHVINLGSVGKPKDGDLRAGYVLVDLYQLLSSKEPKAWQPDFRRLSYDLESSVQALRNSEFPDKYADALAQGK